MISEIILAIMIFAIGFCFGALFELKEVEKTNKEWFLIAKKINGDWAEYCETLIDEIKTLKGSDGE